MRGYLVLAIRHHQFYHDKIMYHATYYIPWLISINSKLMRNEIINIVMEKKDLFIDSLNRKFKIYYNCFQIRNKKLHLLNNIFKRSYLNKKI